MAERACSFIPVNRRPEKPRSRGLTGIRGPYYATVGPNDLRDVLGTMGHHIDGFEYASGTFALISPDRVREMNHLCHQHDVYAATGGWIEHVLTHGPQAVTAYVEECKRLGFDVIELSTGFISLPRFS